MSRAPIRAPRCLPPSLVAPSRNGHRKARGEAARWFGRRLRAGVGAACIAIVASSACGDDGPTGPELSPDAGPACERGTRNCACIGGSGCRDALLCIAGRCQAMSDEEPPTTTPRPRPRPELPDPGDTDAGNAPTPADAGAADASVSGDDGTSPSAPDAGDDAG